MYLVVWLDAGTYDFNLKKRHRPEEVTEKDRLLDSRFIGKLTLSIERVLRLVLYVI